MKKIEIEKQLDLEEATDLLTLDSRNHFVYRKEEGGIRCVGPFYLQGTYSTLQEIKHFSDVFEFDIFASNEKLDHENFQLVYTGYDYTLKHGCVVTLYFDVHGIYGEKEKYEEDKESFLEEVKESIEKNAEEYIEVNEEELDLSMMEELFEEKDNVITSYSFVVVKPLDSYESIALRYEVDPLILREVNKDKTLQEKDLVILPYAREN